MQFMNSSLDKNLSDADFKYLVEEFGSGHLELLKQKDAYPYEFMNSFERFKKKKNCLLKNVSLVQQKKKKKKKNLVMMAKYQTVT